MPTDCSTIDLATLNTAQGVMVIAMRGKVCQWEQQLLDILVLEVASAQEEAQELEVLFTGTSYTQGSHPKKQ